MHNAAGKPACFRSIERYCYGTRMKHQNRPLNLNRLSAKNLLPALGLTVAILSWGTLASYAADDAGAQKLLAQARAKEVHAQELRSAAAAAVQKAADDQTEATVEDRDAKILTAQAMKLMGADANKQRAFKIRVEARKFASDSHQHLIAARNAEQKAAQLSRNAEELNKAAAQLKDQPDVAATLESEAKDDAAKAQTELQTANTDKFSAQGLEERAKAAWAAAEKLDPQTHSQVAPASPKPQLAEPRPVK